MVPSPFHGSLCGDYLPERVSALRSAADYRENDPALVRRICRGLDYRVDVFPDHAARRLCLCVRHNALSQTARPGPAARQSARPQLVASSHHPFARLENGLQWRPHSAHRSAAHCGCRSAILHAFDHRSAAPSLVCSLAAGRDAIPFIRNFQRWLDASSYQFPHRRRTISAWTRASQYLVRCVRCIRDRRCSNRSRSVQARATTGPEHYRRAAFAHNPDLLDRPCRLRIRFAAGYHQPPLAKRGADSFSMGAHPRHLSRNIHPLFRKRSQLPARSVYPAACNCSRRHVLRTLLSIRKPGTLLGAAALRRRTLRLLHGLPR